MLNQHPITPPPELVQQCWDELRDQTQDLDAAKAWGKAITLAYQAGADQELEACLLLVGDGRRENLSQVIALRDARRPKTPSLKEQALADLNTMTIEPCWINGIDTNAPVRAKYDTIRRALEALDD
jgi:hypothetical protein